MNERKHFFSRETKTQLNTLFIVPFIGTSLFGSINEFTGNGEQFDNIAMITSLPLAVGVIVLSEIRRDRIEEL
jgi:uncharacterized membrane protein